MLLGQCSAGAYMYELAGIRQIAWTPRWREPKASWRPRAAQHWAAGTTEHCLHEHATRSPCRRKGTSIIILTRSHSRTAGYP